MDLQAFLLQLVADIQALAPANVKVLPHPGRVDLDELQIYGANAPCIRVAILSSADAGISGAQYDNVSVAAYLITKALNTATPDAGNRFLATFIKGQIWSQPSIGGTDASRPKNLNYQNLYSTPVGKAGICLGALTWTQLLELPFYNASNPAPFTDAFTTYELDPPAGGINATDTITLASA